jgi:RNA polymerase sigma factor (sigma-70 family)
VGLDAAEDVVHDTYLVARARVGQLRDPSALEPWLVQICVRRCFRLTKRSRQLVRLIAGMAQPSTEAAAPWLEMRELLEGLGPRERTVLVLHHGYGHTLVEVADLLGISHANARAIASRGRRALLRRWLEAER